MQLEHRKQDWIGAANSYLAKISQIHSLYKNYSSLIDTATNFNTQLGKNWRAAMNALTNQVTIAFITPDILCAQRVVVVCCAAFTLNISFSLYRLHQDCTCAQNVCTSLTHLVLPVCDWHCFF